MCFLKILIAKSSYSKSTMMVMTKRIHTFLSTEILLRCVYRFPIAQLCMNISFVRFPHWNFLCEGCPWSYVEKVSCHSFAEQDQEFLWFYRFYWYTQRLKFDQTLVLLHLHLYSANSDCRSRNYIFLINVKTYEALLTGENKREWTTSRPRDRGDAGATIGRGHRE